MVNGLDDFINANTKNSEITHCSCLRYTIIYRPEKKTGKID